jgi:DNA end-binding protein Ku
VNIPVELHTAVRDSRLRFRLLHATDRSPINVERVCRKEGLAVAWNDLVKGYEYQKGRFVVLTKEDFAAAALQQSKRIDVIDFVSAREIDDRFFDTPYYLTAGKGGDEAYALLREAIRTTDRIGIAKFILRDVQHLAAVEALGDALVLSTLRFAEELVDVRSLSFPNTTHLRKKELDLATALVEGLAADWKPEKYTDEYRQNLMRVIRAKRKGTAPDLEPKEPQRDPSVVDLMERLRRSLSGLGKREHRLAANAHTRGRPALRSKRRAQRRHVA